MDIAVLNIFIGVMHRRSFTEVARELGLSASAVSRSIASLEEELGVKLFQRTTRRVSPTEAAKIYFESIESIVRELEQANVQAGNLVSRPQGTLRITCPVSFSDSILTKMLAKFSESYPELAIELVVSNSVHDLRAERIDVAVRYGHLRDSSLIASRLCTFKEIICASPAYLAKHGTPRSPTELQGHSCLLFLLPSYPLSWRFRKPDGPESTVPLRVSFRSSSAQTLKQCTVNGMGITLLPEISVKSSIDEGLLVPLFKEYEVTARQFGASIWVVYPSKEYLPLRARVFIDSLKEFIAKMGKEA